MNSFLILMIIITQMNSTKNECFINVRRLVKNPLQTPACSFFIHFLSRTDVAAEWPESIWIHTVRVNWKSRAEVEALYYNSTRVARKEMRCEFRRHDMLGSTTPNGLSSAYCLIVWPQNVDVQIFAYNVCKHTVFCHFFQSNTLVLRKLCKPS